MNKVHSLSLILWSVFPDHGSKWPMIHWEYWIPDLPA